jgi:deoxyhypusine synthase
MSASAQQHVLVETVGSMPEGSEEVRGYDFNDGIDYQRLFEAYKTMGFQATNAGRAIDEIKRMLEWRMSEDEAKQANLSAEERDAARCKIFLGYTSNLISSGMRETLRYLAEHKLVDVIVTTAGGIEEDFIKCLAPTYMGDFSIKGAGLRAKGINRIGNLLIPNDNYCKFEQWMAPILDAMHAEQESDGVVWTPSRMIARLGKEIDNEESVYYWAQRNNIPVFCPAITDGSIGDMLYFHTFNVDTPLTLDITRDIRAINDQAIRNTHKTGMLILGGGLIKHHICNANLMRNGADFSVFINTGQEYDGSDSGARPDEAVSWGKISLEAKPVKVYAEVTLVFPFIAAESFVRYNQQKQAEQAAASE